MQIKIYDTYSKNLENKKDHYFWNSLIKSKNSIDFLLDKNKKKIKDKYLSIIEEIVRNNKIKNNYFFYNGISLDELSLISEKNPFKSYRIYDCLKLLVLEDLIKKNKVKKITYFGSSVKLGLSLKELSHNLNLKYSQNINKVELNFKIISILRAFYFFYKFIYKNNLKKTKIKKFSDITFFGYFLHFKDKNSNQYDSYLWNGISKKLDSMKINSNWFHFFVPSSQIKNINEAKNKLIKINNFNKENHLLLNTQLSFCQLMVIFFKYLVLTFKNIIFLNRKKLLINSFSKSNFSYFLVEDINKSYFGEVLVYNLHIILTLDQILSKIPKQKLGFYLLENQGWEKCLNILWKKYNHKILAGYLHSTIRFWDLRYFKCKKEFNTNQNPDLFLFNGKYSKNIGIKNYYPSKKSKEVEAVRYNHLLKANKIKINKNKILIIGDMHNYENHFVANQVGIIKYLFPGKKFYYKPHPSNTSKMISELKDKFKFLKILKPITKVDFANYFKIICTNSTSAILDCVIQKQDFCSIKSYSTLDLFPIDDQKLQKKRIFSSYELIKFLKKKSKVNVSQDYLHLNKDLTNWKKIIRNNY